MVVLVIIVCIVGAVGGLIGSIFGSQVTENEYESIHKDIDFKARCDSMGGTYSITNCYKEGEIIFSKE